MNDTLICDLTDGVSSLTVLIFTSDNFFSEKLEMYVKRIDAVYMFTSASIDVVNAFTSGKIFLGWAVSEILVI